jgi:hypothetical protein
MRNPVQLSTDLDANLKWLKANWEDKGWQLSSEYNRRFYDAMVSMISGTATDDDVKILIEGTSGKVADGYAHLLTVTTAERKADPWVALRRLGNIATQLRQYLG